MRAEYEQTKDLAEGELAQYWAERPMRMRNQLYEALEGPQEGYAATLENAKAAADARAKQALAAEADALAAARQKEGRHDLQAELERKAATMR